jgi:hypothetical protein
MNEVREVENSNMVAAFGVTEDGLLMVRVKGSTFGGKNAASKPDVFYFYRPTNARQVFADMDAADSKGRFFIQNIKALPVVEKRPVTH